MLCREEHVRYCVTKYFGFDKDESFSCAENVSTAEDTGAGGRPEEGYLVFHRDEFLVVRHCGGSRASTGVIGNGHQDSAVDETMLL